MALLRPCGRFFLAFSKFPVSCQFEYIRGIERLARIQGYVTTVRRPEDSINEKLEVSSSNISASESTSLFNDVPRTLISLYFGTKDGRIQKQDLSRILEKYITGKDELRTSSGLAVLQHCGSLLYHVQSVDRQNLTNQVWQIIARDPSQLTLKHYNTLLSIYVQNNQRIDPKEFLDNMTVKPDISTYTLLLNTAAKCGDVESSLQVLSIMKEAGHSLNKTIFNLLILAHSNNRDINTALSTLESMKSARIQPSVDTYANIACGYAISGDIEKTLKILNAHRLNTTQIMDIIKHLSSANLGRHIPDVLKFIETPIKPSDTTLLIDTLTELTHGGRPEDAFELINCLTPVASNTKTNMIFEGFLKNMVRAGIPSSTVLEFMNKMMEKKSYSLAMMDVCEIALRSGERDLAMAVLESMHERKIEVRPHYYWPLFVQASRDHGENQVSQTLRHMFCLNVKVDHDTMLHHVIPYINTVDPFTTLRKLNDLGLENSVVLTPLVCYLLDLGKIKAAVALCSRGVATVDFEKLMPHLTVAYRHTKNIGEFAKIFQFAPSDKFYQEEFLHIVFGKSSSGKKAKQLNEFLRAFQYLGIPVSNFTVVESQEDDATITSGEITLINPLDSVKTVGRIPHPKDMNLEELECHLIELKAKNMNVRGLLRKLLQAQCQVTNLERVEELKSEYDKAGFMWTPGMNASLMQLYAQTGKLEEAMKLYWQLKNSNYFKIDDNKLLLLATALVKANMISDAFTILESETSNGKSVIYQNCWRLLDAVAHSESPELTESMLEILVNARFCDRTNMLMGPLVRVHFLKDNITSAVETFVKCAESYGFTPLRQELVYALVKSINTNKSNKNESIKLLKQVQSITERLYGKANVQADLIIALAQLEMRDELRKFIQKNQLPVQYVVRSLAVVPRDAKHSVLKTILEASEEIPDIDKTFIYEELFWGYNRSGNCEEAIKLWKKMIADNIIVSRTVRTRLESLLTKHKVPLPEGLTDTRLRE